MAIMKFRQYVRKAITYDGATFATAKPLSEVIPEGTSGTVTLVTDPSAGSSDSLVLWISFRLSSGTSYTIGTGDAYYGGCALYDEAQAKVAEETFSYDNYTTTALTYTPAAAGVYVLKVPGYSYNGASKTVTFSTRPLDYTPPSLTPNQTSSGFDAFGYPIRHRSALDAGVDAGGITTDGLLLYHPLDENLTSLPTGQTSTNSGTVSYQTYKGVPCAKFDSSCVRFGNLTTLSYPATMSVWYNMTETTNDFMFLAMLAPIGIGFNYKKVAAYNDWDYSSEQPLDTWVHVAVVWETESKRKLFINSELKHEYESTNANNSSSGDNRNQVGGDSDNNPRYFKGYAAGLRVYSRALKDAEIVKLAKEFKPTT